MFLNMPLGRALLCALAIIAPTALVTYAAESKWLMPFLTDTGSERVAIKVDQMPDDARVELWNDGTILSLTPAQVKDLMPSQNARQGLSAACGSDEVCKAGNYMAKTYTAWTAIRNAETEKPGTVDAREGPRFKEFLRSVDRLRKAHELTQ